MRALTFIFIFAIGLIGQISVHANTTEIIEDVLTESNAIVKAIDRDDVTTLNAWLASGHSPVSKIKNKLRQKLVDRSISQGALHCFEALLKSVHQLRLESKLVDGRGTPVLVSLSGLAVPNKNKTSRYEQMISLVLLLNPEILTAKDHAYIGDGRSALQQAAAVGNIKVMKILIEHGAQVNEKNANGETALHFAARFGHLDAVKYLISSGALVNEKTRYTKSTPLMAAAEMGQANVIRFLMISGADRDAKDAFGKTAPERYREFRVASNSTHRKRK